MPELSLGNLRRGEVIFLKAERWGSGKALFDQNLTYSTKLLGGLNNNILVDRYVKCEVTNNHFLQGLVQNTVLHEIMLEIITISRILFFWSGKSHKMSPSLVAFKFPCFLSLIYSRDQSYGMIQHTYTHTHTQRQPQQKQNIHRKYSPPCMRCTSFSILFKTCCHVFINWF